MTIDLGFCRTRKIDILIYPLTNLTELAEAAEFEIYEKYADDITSTHSKEALQNLLLRQDVSQIECTLYLIIY